MSTPSKFRYAMVCSSNMNRSMSAHATLRDHQFRVESYGSGNMVRLPGKTVDDPNCFDFGTPYEDIYDALVAQDPTLYSDTGILALLERNMSVKKAPEHFQSTSELFDVIVTAEERVFDQVVDHMQRRPETLSRPVHVVGLEIRDNPQEAELAANDVLVLCRRLDQSDDLDEDIDEILEAIQTEIGRTLLHSVEFY